MIARITRYRGLVKAEVSRCLQDQKSFTVSSYEFTEPVSDRLRIRLIHHVFGATRGGVERDVLVMIKSLPEYDHFVVVFGDDGPMTEDWRSAGATVEVFGSKIR